VRVDFTVTTMPLWRHHRSKRTGAVADFQTTSSLVRIRGTYDQLDQIEVDQENFAHAACPADAISRKRSSKNVFVWRV